METPVPRKRTGEEQSGESMVEPVVLDITENEAVNDVVDKAKRDDDPSQQEPTTKVSSVTPESMTETEPKPFAQRLLGDPMLNDRAKTTLEVAMGKTLQDLAGTEGDPEDIQKKIQDQAVGNEEQLSADKQSQQQQD